MSKRSDPTYRRFTEFGVSAKPREFLKGFLPKGTISGKMEVDHRKALMGTKTDIEFSDALKKLAKEAKATSVAYEKSTKPVSSGGIATGSGTIYPRTWSSSTGTALGSGWTSLGSTWGTVTWGYPQELTDEQCAMVADAICEQVATHPIPSPYFPTFIGGGSAIYGSGAITGGTITSKSTSTWTFDEK